MMKSKWYIWGLVLILSVWGVTGCGTSVVQPTETPTDVQTGVVAELANPASVYCQEQGYTSEMRTDADGGQYSVCIFPDGSECEEWAFFRGECGFSSEEAVDAPDPTRARDAALAYIVGRYGDQAPAPELVWTEEAITPEGLVGSPSFQYSAGDWGITVSFPLVAPQATIYQVVMSNRATGFQWEGEVDAAGQVKELVSPADADPTGGLSVVGWYGYVLSLPDGSQYDDYLVVLPAGTAEVGLDSMDEVVQAEIEAMRDSGEPGQYAHFWGTLICDVPDYNGCQLVVSHLRPDGPGPFFAPDPVEGWEGVIYSGPPGARSGGDDYFVLTGDFKVQYGIEAAPADSSVGEQLASLHDTGTVVRVWGELTAGVPDWNGTQIQVNRIEIVEESSASAPPPLPEWPDDEIVVYVNEDFGYQIEVPSSATITEIGVTSFPSDELPEGMSGDEYLAQLQAQYSNKLCVGIQYGLGYIYIAAPNLDHRYAICGRTGVGAGEMIAKTEPVTIGGQTYTADGFEFVSNVPGADDSLTYHEETLYIQLADGARIEYGSVPRADATYEDYVVKGKGMLLRILASYGPIQ
jgi:putative hemolysin